MKNACRNNKRSTQYSARRYTSYSKFPRRPRGPKAEFELPAGTYYVGDPCYVLKSVWKQVGDATNWFENMTAPAHINLKSDDSALQKFVVWAGSTAYGDGCYFDNNDKKYHVDAGIIGIVSWPDGVKFDAPFTVKYEDGVFDFGGIIIDTN